MNRYTLLSWAIKLTVAGLICMAIGTTVFFFAILVVSVLCLFVDFMLDLEEKGAELNRKRDKNRKSGRQ